MLGLTEVGIELDAAACATRSAAGHTTVRADVSAFWPGPLRDVTGLIGSPPCVVFSAAGKRGGVAVAEILAQLIPDLFAGKRTRKFRRREMARALNAAWWPDPKLTRAERKRRIWQAVRSASLVAEPARFIAACRPEWVALEQVPSVLPLWKVYAAELRKMGYHVWCGKLNAANYGVPQTRERAILIASRVRRVSCPPPTHYDPRKGDQLFGERWVSMATALGWGATDRPPPTVTAGGTRTGGAEPFGHRDRDALAAEQEAGRWALRMDTQEKATLPRPLDEPAPTMQFAHRSNLARWVLQGPVQVQSRRPHPRPNHGRASNDGRLRALQHGLPERPCWSARRRRRAPGTAHEPRPGAGRHTADRRPVDRARARADSQSGRAVESQVLPQQQQQQRLRKVAGRASRDPVLRPPVQLGCVGGRASGYLCPGRPTRGSPWTQVQGARGVPVRGRLGKDHADRSGDPPVLPRRLPLARDKDEGF